MTETRKIELAVKMSNAPYAVPSQTDAAASGGSVTLTNAPFYAASTSAEPAVYKSGVFYFYDGILINGRYRMTNVPSRVGKTPIGENVTGWVNASDCPAASSAGSSAAGGEAGTEISCYIESMTYTDSAAESSDSIEITLDAQKSEWLLNRLPENGATIKAKILGENWEKEGEKSCVSCGMFSIDDINYSDSPSELRLGGVSKPSDSNFSERERETIWQNTSIKKIGETIAARYGLVLKFDADDYDIACDEQDGTDSSYYNSLCERYGLVLKVYARFLWIYDREKYKAKRAVKTFERKDMTAGSFNYSAVIFGKYTGGIFNYTDPDKDTDISCSCGDGARIKAVNSPASSVYDASIQLCAALNNANHGAKSVSFAVDGEWTVSAGNCIEINGFGNLDGKYFVDKVTHRISKDGFTSSIDCSKVERGFTTGDVGGGILNYEAAAASEIKYNSVQTTEVSAGGSVTLTNAPFYAASTSAEPAVYKSGVFYFYDGILINGRYRMTNSAARCSKLPIGENVTGWVPAEYCKGE